MIFFFLFINIKFCKDLRKILKTSLEGPCEYSSYLLVDIIGSNSKGQIEISKHARHLQCNKFPLLSDPNVHVLRKTLIDPRHEKTGFCICENKDADQLRGNREADQRLVFAIRIVQSLFYLNPKFQASSHLLWLYSPVCVGPGRKSRRPVFSQRGSIGIGRRSFVVKLTSLHVNV